MNRPSQATCMLLFMFGQPSSAAEIWFCTTHNVSMPGSTELSPGHDQIKIEADDLAWTYGTAASSPMRHYHVLVNNDVGAVAEFAQATSSPAPLTITGLSPDQAAALMARLHPPSPMIDAYVIALDKKSGVLRTGSVGTKGIHENWTGECQLQSVAAPTVPQNPN